MGKIDILVVGAGQAGLAMGYHLQRTPFRFQLVDAHARIGESWRRRYDSLTLFTPRRYSALPGLSMDGDPWGYATRDEFASYLEHYARRFVLPVQPGTTIVRLERSDGRFLAHSAAGDIYEARSVVIATGAFQYPAIPPIAQGLASDVQQLSVDQYHNPAHVHSGVVLVVGDGASGRDIAAELVKTHTVYLATGRPRRLLPERILGISIWWWFDKLGLLDRSDQTALGRFVRKADPFPARGKSNKHLRRNGVQMVGRVVHMQNRTVRFENGASAQVDAVIWATGYKERFDWVAVPGAVDEQGALIHQRGMLPVPGLYVIGQPWQRNRGSALIHGVGADAAVIAQQLRVWLQLDAEPASAHLTHSHPG